MDAMKPIAYPARIPDGEAAKDPRRARLWTSIQELRVRTTRDFAASLEERKKREREWANFSRDESRPGAEDATNESNRGNYKWYSTTQVSMAYRDAWLASQVPGKVVLDYACGDGHETLKVARLGADLAIGIDVSEVSLATGERVAKQQGLGERCIFIQTDCENTGLPDESIDVILCSYMLHHLDLKKAYPEMWRILKKGGKVLACEALNYNPLIKLYRNLTPEMRTEWEKEHILSLKDVRMAKKYFNIGSIRYWHMLSVLGAFARRSPRVFTRIMPVLNGVDSFLTSIPGIQLMAWQFSFELVKPHS